MRLSKANPGNVPAGATLTASKAIHDGKTITMETLTGTTITLPAALGLGTKLRIFDRVAATSNSNIIKVANATDVMVGVIVVTGTTTNGFGTAATSDTITMNRTTTGGATNGSWIEVEDLKPGFWAVRGTLVGSGTPATPFSATVS